MVRSALRASNHQAAYRFARCGLRADLPDSGQITVHSHLQKYIPSRFAQIKTINPAVSSHQEGRLATVTNAGRDAVDADVLWTNSTKADGEVVWSWRLDAGVKSAGSVPLATVTTKPDHRGEHVISRKAIARGMPDDFGVTVVTTLVCFSLFACEAAGASSARHSLRPLNFRCAS